MNEITYHSVKNLRDIIFTLIAEHGSQTAVARNLGISTGYLGDILHGRTEISADVAGRLGFDRIIVYTRRWRHRE